jgi:regulatory protein
MQSGFKKKKYDKFMALEKAKHYCAYQERAHSEVKTKLYSWGLYASEVNDILSDLISENFLNEQRFAESYVTGKFRIKGWGKTKITIYLKQKQVSERCIAQAFQAIDNEEYLNTCMRLAQKKSKLLPAELSTWERKGKLSRYLVSKGFEYSVIQQTLLEL